MNAFLAQIDIGHNLSTSIIEDFRSSSRTLKIETRNNGVHISSYDRLCSNSTFNEIENEVEVSLIICFLTRDAFCYCS